MIFTPATDLASEVG